MDKELRDFSRKFLCFLCELGGGRWCPELEGNTVED